MRVGWDQTISLASDCRFVNVYREAIIRVVVSGPQGQEQEIEALVDTGFNGFLTLPSSLITILGLPFRRRGRAVLADGSESLFDIYEATLLWDGQLRRIAVDAVDTDSTSRHGFIARLRVEASSSSRR
ncbi:MAG: hypothetical protein JO235_00495 [Chroococcidiopsidaceae cyanobacterium CP_BM_RX_35]|nr:hypothetical protein [Chroococcidiopsidaceae cyanobacterium CP_BM_RX_35]